MRYKSMPSYEQIKKIEEARQKNDDELFERLMSMYAENGKDFFDVRDEVKRKGGEHFFKRYIEEVPIDLRKKYQEIEIAILASENINSSMLMESIKNNKDRFFALNMYTYFEHNEGKKRSDVFGKLSLEQVVQILEDPEIKMDFDIIYSESFRKQVFPKFNFTDSNNLDMVKRMLKGRLLSLECFKKEESTRYIEGNRFFNKYFGECRSGIEFVDKLMELTDDGQKETPYEKGDPFYVLASFRRKFGLDLALKMDERINEGDLMIKNDYNKVGYKYLATAFLTAYKEIGEQSKIDQEMIKNEKDERFADEINEMFGEVNKNNVKLDTYEDPFGGGR